ncbi:hypothetical protein EON65_39265 [archaeon]|nr:MAG: hypothetical protein EON65_39265 [archaeon]
MELRKVCNHPFLIKGAVTELCKWYDNMGGDGLGGVGGGSGSTIGVGAGRLGGMYDAASMRDILVKTSGKMTLLDKLLPKLHADRHRVLIFSQFRIMLDILEDYLHYVGYMYERVDGSVTGKKRQAAIDRYTNNDQVFVMLLSTRAGGVGINLTAADTVIIFDR